MDPIHDRVLTRGRRFLTKNLQVDHTFLTALVSDEIITDDDMDLVLSNATRLAKVSCFVDLIKTKGPAAFEALISASAENGQGFIGDYLQDAVANAKEASSAGSESTGESDPMHCTILKQNLVYLEEHLKVDKPFILHLRSADALTADERKRVMAESDPGEKFAALYEVLLTKPPHSYAAFLNAMEATGQVAVLQKLHEYEFEAKRKHERCSGMTGRSPALGKEKQKATTDLPFAPVLHRTEQFLIEHLSVTFVFLGYLIMNYAITPSEKDLLKKPYLTKKQKAWILCGIIAGKGCGSFNGFLAALTASGQEHVKSHMVRALADCESHQANIGLKGAMAASDEHEAAGGRGSGLVVEAADHLAAQLDRLCIEGSDINSAHRLGMTGLHLAARDAKVMDARTLLRAGANIEARTRYNFTPLHLACSYGRPEIAELLLHLGADVDARGDDNNTPLHLACWNGQTSIVHILMQAGASTQLRDKHGRMPRELARRRGHTTILQLLPT